MKQNKLIYSAQEHHKVINELNNFADLVRKYNLSDGAKEELSGKLSGILAILAFEVESDN